MQNKQGRGREGVCVVSQTLDFSWSLIKAKLLGLGLIWKIVFGAFKLDRRASAPCPFRCCGEVRVWRLSCRVLTSPKPFNFGASVA